MNETNSVEADEPDNKRLMELMQEQRDVISMMQIQLDMQKERLDSQEKILQELKTEITSLKACQSSTTPTSDSAAALTVTSNDWTSSDANTPVADLVKKAAEETLRNNAQHANYVYDSKTGLYFDEVSGYYYNPTQGLFYNGHTRTYYKYDQASSTYIFHSQLPENNPNKKSPKPQKPVTKQKKFKKSSEEALKKSKADKLPKSTNGNNDVRSPKSSERLDADVEEGEISDSSSNADLSNNEGEAKIGKEGDDDSDDTDSSTIKSSSVSTTSSRCREECLPCIRAIVMESELPELRKGFLFIVTCMGGSVGREGDMHCILIPDSSVSKHHAEIHYSAEEGKFYVTDTGSQNGTFLNGSRLSDAKVTSEAAEVLHGSTLKVGSTTMLVHIHAGTLTCAMCEPGLIPTNNAKEFVFGPVVTKEKKEELRKRQLKKLRQKYCVEVHSQAQSRLPDQYLDRAEERRMLKGSDNPFEKTQVASMDEAISQDNKGFRMLSKMGWNAGTALGRSPTPGSFLAQTSQHQQQQLASSSAAITEPIKVEARPAKMGLGFEVGRETGAGGTESSAGSISFRMKSMNNKKKKNVSSSKNEINEKTLKRFVEIGSTTTGNDGGDGDFDVIEVPSEFPPQ